MQKKYVVLKHPQNPTRAVEEGFSWWGLIFNDLWLLYHGFWGKFGLFELARSMLYLALVISLQMGSLFGAITFGLLQIALMIAVGYFGNNWLIDKLVNRKGYEEVGVYVARSVEEAVEAHTKAPHEGTDISPNHSKKKARAVTDDVGIWVLKIVKAFGVVLLLMLAVFVSATANQMLKNLS